MPDPTQQKKAPSSAEQQIAAGIGNNGVGHNNVLASQAASTYDGANKSMPPTIGGNEGGFNVAMRNSNIDSLTNTGGLDSVAHMGEEINLLNIAEGNNAPFGVSTGSLDINGLEQQVNLSTATSATSGLNIGGPSPGVMGNKQGGQGHGV